MLKMVVLLNRRAVKLCVIVGLLLLMKALMGKVQQSAVALWSAHTNMYGAPGMDVGMSNLSQHLVLYDIDHPPATSNHDCTNRLTQSGVSPPPVICIHDPKVDIYISASIKNQGVWEAASVALFVELLKLDPEMGVLDIGANIGQYSILATSLGHRVVAVEARLSHVKMIHRSVWLNGKPSPGQVVLLENAVSDAHRNVTLQLSKLNQGATKVIQADLCGRRAKGATRSSCHSVRTILLDDLIPVLTFNRAILKVDIEGDEYRALMHSSKLLRVIFVPYIFLEWVFLKKGDVENAEQVINFLKVRNYNPFSIHRAPLEVAEWKDWPNDIIWVHRIARL